MPHDRHPAPGARDRAIAPTLHARREPARLARLPSPAMRQSAFTGREVPAVKRRRHAASQPEPRSDRPRRVRTRPARPRSGSRSVVARPERLGERPKRPGSRPRSVVSLAHLVCAVLHRADGVSMVIPCGSMPHKCGIHAVSTHLHSGLGRLHGPMSPHPRAHPSSPRALSRSMTSERHLHGANCECLSFRARPWRS